ncbi:MAG TPA: ABC transporter ATP-binding protein, partial [Phycisphaerae bacterium]|nr:ABC transporter ATP-binding protein [Phycisphaerae bacterium]
LDSGKVWLNNVEATALSRRQQNNTRCRDVGFVFQFYHLMPELNVIENVMLPAMVDSTAGGWLGNRSKAKKQAREMLDTLGLGERLKHKPRQLSGGERQRVAIARALMNRPSILLADEPTGNLDSKAGKEIIDVLSDFNKKTGQTLVMVTHDQKLASRADRILHLTDGKIDKPSPQSRRDGR